jgi:lysophospholipase L1-like esterase
VLAPEPDLVVIQFGINDSAVDVWKDPPAAEPRLARDRYRENLAFFVRELRARGSAVVLMTPNPVRWTPSLRKTYGKPPYRPEDPDGFNVLLGSYAELVREVAAAEGVPLVDVYAAFRDFSGEGGLTVDGLLSDGMHPNETGHRLVADLLLPEVLKAAGRR